MKKTKKILSILLALAMVLGMIPAMSLTAYADTEYQIWVGGTRVTSANAGNIDGNNKASYNADTNTLTLNGYTNSGTARADIQSGVNNAAIYYNDNMSSPNPLTIQLAEGTTNSLTMTGDRVYGIYVFGSALTITGNGTLNVQSDEMAINDAWGVAITGGTVNAASSAYYGIGRVTIGADISSVTITGELGAIYGGSNEEQELINAVAGTGWTDTAGTTGKADIAISTTGQNVSSYKKVQFPAPASGELGTGVLYVTGVDIVAAGGTISTETPGVNGGTISLSYDEAGNPILTCVNFSYEGAGSSLEFGGKTYGAAIKFLSDKPLTITGKCYLGTAASSYDGYYGIYTQGDLIVTNKAVANLGVSPAGGNVRKSIAVYCKNLTATKSNLAFVSNAATGENGVSYGLYATGTVSIENGSTLYSVTEGNATEKNVGVYADVLNTTGEVTAKSRAAKFSAGICADTSITADNCTIKASSGNGTDYAIGVATGTFDAPGSLVLNNSTLKANAGESNSASVGVYSDVTVNSSVIETTSSYTGFVGTAAPVSGEDRLNVKNGQTIDAAKASKANIVNSWSVTPETIPDNSLCTVIKNYEHTHDFTFSADCETIIAVCGAEDCDLADSKATLTIVAPTLTTYGGTGDRRATLTSSLANYVAFKNLTGTSFSEESIKYYNVDVYEIDNNIYKKLGDELGEAPTAPGEYVAGLTLNSVKVSETETDDVRALLMYTIDKATPDYTAPTGLEATYGDTLANVALPAGWAWEDASTTSVGNAGNNTFKATFTPTDTDNYKVVTGIDVKVQVKRANITPSVIMEGWTYGVAANTPLVVGNLGNGTVTYTYAKKGSDSFSATVPTNAGDYTVKATIAQSTNYNGGEATADFTITKADLTPSVTLEGWAYGQAAKTPVVTGNSGSGAVTYTYATKGSDSFSATVPTNAGEYTVKATIAETANYNGGMAVYHFTIAKADINPTVTLAGWTYGEAANAPSVSGNTGEGAATYTYAAKGSDSFSATVPVNAGNYTVKATIEATANYANAVATADFTIAKAAINPTVTITGWTYGETANAPSVSGNTDNGAATYTYATKGSDSFSATVPTAAGNYTVKATVAQTANYQGATATADFTIAKADITPSVSLEGWTYGEAAKTPVVSGNLGNGAVTFTYAKQGVKGSPYSDKVPTNAGDYVVKATIAQTANYNGGEATADFTIAKADITPSVSLEGWTYGEAANAPSVSGNTGNGAATYTYATKGSDSFSATVPTNAGNYTVKATIAETANYNGKTVTADFTIAKADITPSVSLEGWTYGEAANTPVVSGNSGEGDITYTYAVKGTDEFGTEAPVIAGDYTVKATIAETANYNGGEATADYTIAKANIAPTVSIDGWTYGEEANKPTVSGNTEDGEVTYSYAAKGGDEFSAEVPTKAGEYTVKATIAATDNYTNAVATADFTIAKAKITITADNKSSKREADLKALTYKVNGKIAQGDNLGIKLSTNAKAAVAGKYTIKVAYTANANYTVTVVSGTYTVTDRITASEKAKGNNTINSAIQGTLNKNGSVKVTWGKVANAGKYEIYANYCGAKYNCKLIKTVSGNTTSFDITKLNGKKLNLKKSVKLYVVAYRKVNGKYEKIVQSISLHIVGKEDAKFANAKAIKVSKTSYTLKVNKTATIKPTIVLQNSKKKAVEHADKFRYQSTNTSVATVGTNGKITAKGKGSCTIYIFANNGKFKAIKITVK